MRFDINIPYTGEERVVRRFALFPTIIQGTCYWLEWIKIHQSYNTRHSGWNNDWVVQQENIMDYRIINNHGHYEVYIDGKFYCSADTVTEAIHEVVNDYLN